MKYKYKGKIFKEQFFGDYWKVIGETPSMVLIEATYFSGRPSPNTLGSSCIEQIKNNTCPFPKCNYRRNQFCLSPEYLLRDIEISKLAFVREVMLNKVKFADWSHRDISGNPTCYSDGYRRGKIFKERY